MCHGVCSLFSCCNVYHGVYILLGCVFLSQELSSSDESEDEGVAMETGPLHSKKPIRHDYIWQDEVGRVQINVHWLC